MSLLLNLFGYSLMCASCSPTYRPLACILCLLMRKGASLRDGWMDGGKEQHKHGMDAYELYKKKQSYAKRQHEHFPLHPLSFFQIVTYQHRIIKDF
jgi:hypothetical protein